MVPNDAGIIEVRSDKVQSPENLQSIAEVHANTNPGDIAKMALSLEPDPGALSNVQLNDSTASGGSTVEGAKQYSAASTRSEEQQGGPSNNELESEPSTEQIPEIGYVVRLYQNNGSKYPTFIQDVMYNYRLTTMLDVRENAQANAFVLCERRNVFTVDSNAILHNKDYIGNTDIVGLYTLQICSRELRNALKAVV